MDRQRFLFRDSKGEVPWRDALIELIKAEGDFLLITSAYFELSIDEENLTGAKLEMTKKNKEFLEVAFKSWILNENVKKPFLCFGGGDFKIYNRNDSTEEEKIKEKKKAEDRKNSYIKITDYIRNFCEKICKQNNKELIFARSASGENIFHAKIAIKMEKNIFEDNFSKVNAILVGSSNLTNAAFSNTPFFNYESDIFFYKDNILKSNSSDHFLKLCDNLDEMDCALSSNMFEYKKEEVVLDFKIEDGTIDKIGEKICKTVEQLIENREFCDI